MRICFGNTQPRPSIVGDIPADQPALTRAWEAADRTVKAGYAWPDNTSAIDCVINEAEEFRQTPSEDELGDILFSVISLAQHFGMNPETALHGAVNKFIQRFQAMEALASKPLKELSLQEWDTLWKLAKKQLDPPPTTG